MADYEHKRFRYRYQLLAGSIVAFVVLIASGCGSVQTGSSKPQSPADGSIFAWGNNEYGQLGDGTRTSRSIPEQLTSLSGVTSVAAGDNFTIALVKNTVWAWGGNDGNIGDGTTTNATTPTEVKGLPPITSIAAGGNDSMALATNGDVWTWGDNTTGEIGNGSISGDMCSCVMVPQKVPSLKNITAIAAGGNSEEGGFELAVSATGEVWAWGADSVGQLGTGLTGSSACSCLSTPHQIAGLTGVTAVAAGSDFGMALESSGAVWVWGNNSSGELGVTTVLTSSIPIEVAGIPPAVGIAASKGTQGEFCLAITVTHTVWVWGDNSMDEHGTGTEGMSTAPELIPSLTGVIAIAAGDRFGLAVTQNQKLYAWGANNSGQLGNNLATSASTPKPVVSLSNIRAVTASDNNSIGVYGKLSTSPSPTLTLSPSPSST